MFRRPQGRRAGEPASVPVALGDGGTLSTPSPAQWMGGGGRRWGGSSLPPTPDVLPGYPAAAVGTRTRPSLRRRLAGGARGCQCGRRCCRVRLRYVLAFVLFSVVFLGLVSSWTMSFLNDPPVKQNAVVRRLQQWFHSRRVDGERQPARPTSVPGLTVELPSCGHQGCDIDHGPPYTPSELLKMYSKADFVYTYVNGSELNHVYRALVMRMCGLSLMKEEQQFALNLVSPGVSTCDTMAIREEKTIRGVLERLRRTKDNFMSNRDRETDELRHSLRSVEQHIRWHCGRVVMVSPGHHPQWMDGAKNFLAGTCGGAVVAAQRERGAHLRMTTVHQDAIMPYGMKLTANSHIIEQHLWRVRNVSSVHVYFNDDYFVNRDVQITDLFNEYGGTIVRTESHRIEAAKRAPASGVSWRDSVSHTNLFNIQELDVLPENHLPQQLLSKWDESLQRASKGYAGVEEMPDLTSRQAKSSTNANWLFTTFEFPPEELPASLEALIAKNNLSLTPRELLHHRPNFFATHAPFVYCTNMFRYLNIRYEREMAASALHHRWRVANDILLPFVYNAFVMARPWVASPTFLRYLWYTNLKGVSLDYDEAGEAILRENAAILERQAALRKQGKRVEDEATYDPPRPPQARVVLDNVDGCAPATLLSGPFHAETHFAKFTDEQAQNAAVMETLRVLNPKFFNINAGASRPEARQQLRTFLHEKFSTPIYLEQGHEPVNDEDRAMKELYASLMKLPVVLVTSFAEGLCPMVRSLQLALPDHEGVVLGVVARHGTGSEVDIPLANLRVDLQHRVRSAMPVVSCAYNSRVRVLSAALQRPPASPAEASGVVALRKIFRAALAAAAAEDRAGAPVTLPAGCGRESRVRGLVVDGRSAQLPVWTVDALRHAVTMPGQSLALEDFEVVPMGDGSGDSVLVVSRQSADAKAVHWVDGAAESDLLLTFPIPYEALEDLDAAPVYNPSRS